MPCVSSRPRACRAGPLADGTLWSPASGGLAVGDESQGFVEVLIRQLPDEVEASLAHRRVDLPHVAVVQLPKLLDVVHLTRLTSGEPLARHDGTAASSVHLRETGAPEVARSLSCARLAGSQIPVVLIGDTGEIAVQLGVTDRRAGSRRHGTLGVVVSDHGGVLNEWRSRCFNDVGFRRRWRFNHLDRVLVLIRSTACGSDGRSARGDGCYACDSSLAGNTRLAAVTLRGRGLHAGRAARAWDVSPPGTRLEITALDELLELVEVGSRLAVDEVQRVPGLLDEALGLVLELQPNQRPALTCVREVDGAGVCGTFGGSPRDLLVGQLVQDTGLPLPLHTGDLGDPVQPLVVELADLLDTAHERRELLELGPLVVGHADRYADDDCLLHLGGHPLLLLGSPQTSWAITWYGGCRPCPFGSAQTAGLKGWRGCARSRARRLLS